MKKLSYLEALRGLAALYIVFHHGFWLLWEGFGEYQKHSSTYSPLRKILLILPKAVYFGHEMVLFFFVLSGFVIHLRYSKQLKENGASSFDWKEYFLRRLKRIYPTFLFALLFTYLIDSFGKGLHLPVYFNERVFPPGINRYSLETLLGNAFMLTNSYVPVWGTNVPLWSLKLEWWFYMLFPFFFLLLKRSNTLTFVVQIVLFCLAINPAWWPIRLLADTFTGMLIWWLGVILADVYTKRISIQFKTLGWLMLVIPLAYILKKHISEHFYDLLWGVGFSGFLSIIFHFEQRIEKWRIIKPLAILGSFSYSLYILHMPMQFFMHGLLLKYNKTLPQHFNYVFLSALIAIVFTYLAHIMIERPFISTYPKDIKPLKP